MYFRMDWIVINVTSHQFECIVIEIAITTVIDISRIAFEGLDDFVTFIVRQKDVLPNERVVRFGGAERPIAGLDLV